MSQTVFGLMQLQFCCVEFADGTTPVVGMDAHIPVPYDGGWHVDMVLPYTGTGSTSQVYAYIEVSDANGSPLTPISSIAWGNGPWPTGTITLSTPFSLPGGAKIRAFMYTDSPDGVVVDERAFLAMSPVSPHAVPVAACGQFFG